MAYVRESAGMGAASGALGNVVFAQTQGGTVVRGRPRGSRERSPKQIEQGLRLGIVHHAWNALDDVEAEAWRVYALGHAVRNPATGGMRIPSAYSLFSGLGAKFLQVHGGFAVPSLPPLGRFAGDALSVAVAKGDERLVFSADGASREGVLTELLAQRLKGPHNAAKAKSYVSLGFFEFEAGVPVEVEVGWGAYWACAVRSVEAATGRMTEMVEIGKAR